jgi:hypothetical protein
MPYILKPEVAGGWGAGTIADTSCHPPFVSKLIYEFEGWSGDDLLTSFPCFIVTKQLADSIQSSSLNGYELAPVQVTKSGVFVELYPSRELPEFWWLKVNGVVGRNDFAINDHHRLVVSDTAFKLLSASNIAQCEVEPC